MCGDNEELKSAVVDVVIDIICEAEKEKKKKQREEEKKLNEKKKVYLNGYREAMRNAALLRKQIKELQDVQFNISGGRQDGMPRGSGTADLSIFYADMDELIRKLEAELKDSTVTYTRIHDQIRTVENEVEREVLRRRYLMRQSWEEIAVDMDYAYRHVLRLHGEALKNFEIPV